jgi:hypothetical protein
LSATDINVAVILPSRGLIFSRTAEEILKNVKDVPHRIFFAHRLPIPDCFEKPVLEALKGSYSHIWFVEDDMILPPDTLKRLLDMDKAVVTVDYPTTDYGGGAMFKVKGQVIFAGTGCTLVRREVFDELKPPYFRTDICWNIKNYGDFIKISAVERGGQLDGYGLHDVNFYMNLYRLEIPVHDAGFTLGQRKLVELGKPGSNNGAHHVEEWTKIKKDDLLNKVKKWPIEAKGNLVSVVIGGKELLTSKNHADNLIKKGIGVKPPNRPVVVDWGNT